MYRYQMSNGHYVVEIDGLHFLLDTGAPVSFWLKRSKGSIKIDGKEFILNDGREKTLVAKTEKLVGVPLDGFLGLDILKKTSFTLYKNGTISFASDEVDGTVIPFEDIPGYPYIKVGVNGRPYTYLLDTGAMVAYGPSSLFDGQKPFGQVLDYNPMVGNLAGQGYHLDVVVGGKNKRLDVVDNETVRFLLRGEMIGNVTSFFEEACVFDFKNRRLILK